ncbi:MAG: hypothetical protein LLH30_19455 [Candidatus Manganitrophus sp. SA1]|nr:hypothetical protein [Candidatus Manganitrophus morganii]
MAPLSRKCSIPFFLTVWFFIWGICPWSAPSFVAQAAETAHAEQGHHREADETHHASKGTEHSCTGSISYSVKLKNDRPPDHGVALPNLTFPDDPSISLHPTRGLPKPLLERETLPKLLTEYYQLYSIYRI